MYQILLIILGPCKYYLSRKNGLGRCDYIQNFETGRLSWIIKVAPRLNHLYPYKREAEVDVTHMGNDHVKTE